MGTSFGSPIWDPGAPDPQKYCANGWLHDAGMWRPVWHFLAGTNDFTLFMWGILGIAYMSLQCCTKIQWWTILSVGCGFKSLTMLVKTSILMMETSFLSHTRCTKQELQMLYNRTDDFMDNLGTTRYFSNRPISEYLGIWSMCAPVWLLLTGAVVVQHLRTMKDGHKRIQIIIAFPMLYCVCSYGALLKNFQCVAYGVEFSARFQHNWDITRETYNLASEGTLAVGDFVEACAIWSFAKLTLNVIRKTNQQRTSDFVGNARNVIQNEAATTEKVVLQGILWFCYSCGIYAIMLEIPEFIYDTLGFEEETRYIENYGRDFHGNHRWACYVRGGGCFSSMIALSSLVHLKKQNYEQLNNIAQYNGTCKFLTVKILVSLVFLQSLILLALPHSITEGLVFMHSFLCMECFGLTLLMRHAWATTNADGTEVAWLQWLDDVAFDGPADDNAPSSTNDELPLLDRWLDRRSVVNIAVVDGAASDDAPSSTVDDSTDVDSTDDDSQTSSTSIQPWTTSIQPWLQSLLSLGSRGMQQRTTYEADYVTLRYPLQQEAV